MARWTVLLDFIDMNGEVDTVPVTTRWSHRKAAADAAKLRETIVGAGLDWNGPSMGQCTAYVRRARSVRAAAVETAAFARMADQ